ncbi:MAG TPA: ABC transporter permease [Aggregatilinea sp.]|uniref:ABC transporter permease n=1 Tax=Aggregatilinea sp. TaxID=2806333 RepID=UPI002C7B17D9|nr:ABC transporter permease [Aggregatilinea sp.]HML21733.1 ABC transporter permease [Aggregatilinea sp.]
MTHWFDVFLYEVRQQVRRKSYLFVTFGFPLLAAVAFMGYQAYQETRDSGDETDQPSSSITEEINGTSQVIGLVDLTPDHLFPPPQSYDVTADTCDASNVAALSPAIVKQLTSPGCMRSLIHGYPTVEAGKDALEANEIDVLYVIEPDYTETGQVSEYMTGFSMDTANTDQYVENFVLATLLQRADADTYQTLFFRLRAPATVQEHRVDSAATTKAENENQSFVLVYAFGIILAMSIFWGGGYVMQSVVQEKESRIIEIMLSSVRPLPLLVGKVLAMGTLSLIQVGTLAGTFMLIGGRAGSVFESLGDLSVTPSALALLIVYFVLGYLLFGSAMAAIGAMSTTARESQNYVTFVTFPAMIPFFAMSIIVEEPNGTLAKVLSMIPFTAPMSMGMRVAVIDVPVGELLSSMVLLIVSVIFMFWAASRIFRVNVLLMGTMPKLRDIPKLIRG